ncbi:thermonuclease family protein [Thermocrinis sp.]|jgi:micrococcal nuclease|uniref:thermonuclease family protein n=1 Tax=Thermocrinis sp. TaxID=2024383 RepID=UPI003C00DC21
MWRLLVIPLILFVVSCGNGESTPTSAEKKEITQVEQKGTPCKVVRVIDGDTFTCTLENGEKIKVRLIGVDTPESRESPKLEREVQKSGLQKEEILRMGKIATEFTKKLLPEGEIVYLEQDVQKTDRHGRVLAYVWLKDGRMLNEVLVREGMARVYTIPPNVKYQDVLLEAQRKAREEGKGFWKSGF